MFLKFFIILFGNIINGLINIINALWPIKKKENKSDWKWTGHDFFKPSQFFSGHPVLAEASIDVEIVKYRSLFIVGFARNFEI